MLGQVDEVYLWRGTQQRGHPAKQLPLVTRERTKKTENQRMERQKEVFRIEPVPCRSLKSFSRNIYSTVPLMRRNYLYHNNNTDYERINSRWELFNCCGCS